MTWAVEHAQQSNVAEAPVKELGMVEFNTEMMLWPEVENLSVVESNVCKRQEQEMLKNNWGQGGGANQHRIPKSGPYSEEDSCQCEMLEEKSSTQWVLQTNRVVVHRGQIRHNRKELCGTRRGKKGVPKKFPSQLSSYLGRGGPGRGLQGGV